MLVCRDNAYLDQLMSHMRNNPAINPHADVSSRARGLKFGLSLHLHPYFEYASSEACAARKRDKYQHLT